MSLATNISDAFTRVATESKSLRTLINGNGADLAALTTTAKANLVAAINEVDAQVNQMAADGIASNLDELTDVVITEPTAPATKSGHILRHDGTNWVNVDGASTYQPADSDLTAIAALTTTTYGRAFLTLASQSSLMGLIAAATETASGKVELATNAETTTGTATTLATHPAGVKAAIDAAMTNLGTTYQAKDADLDAIAALTTTAFGRTLLTLADSAALTGQVRVATETATGVVQLATSAETTSATPIATKAVTPAGVKAATDAAIAALIDASPATLDTLNEIAAALGDDPNFATTMTNALANRVRVDTATQGLTATQQANARANINAASATDVGDTNTNFVNVFVAGLA